MLLPTRHSWSALKNLCDSSALLLISFEIHDVVTWLYGQSNQISPSSSNEILCIESLSRPSLPTRSTQSLLWIVCDFDYTCVWLFPNFRSYVSSRLFNGQHDPELRIDEDYSVQGIWILDQRKGWFGAIEWLMFAVAVLVQNSCYPVLEDACSPVFQDSGSPVFQDSGSLSLLAL